MRKTERLFEIIQILRNSSHPLTANALAEELEVSKRTIYRDIQALQAMRTPIDGEAGVGYIMRSGYDLPAMNFSANELDAIAVGLNLLARTGDRSLQLAARTVANKIDTVRCKTNSLLVSDWGMEILDDVDFGLLRFAISQEQKLRIRYKDKLDNETQRYIQPVAMIYYIEVVVLAAWCELREDFRHFRVDRIADSELIEQHFNGGKLHQQWQALQKLTGSL